MIDRYGFQIDGIDVGDDVPRMSASTCAPARGRAARPLGQGHREGQLMCALRVAVVDDSALVRKHLTELLVKAGIEVTITASDPLFAWPKLQADWPDVIVLDVEMPRMDGISFCAS